MTHPAATITGSVVLMAASLSSHLSASDFIIVIGAIGFALSTIRSGRMKVLRETNEDLKTRNEQLETSVTFMAAEAHKAAAEILILKERPTLETHEALLQRLLKRLEAHDTAMAAAAVSSQEVFRLIVEELKAIHTAVVPPE